MLTGSAHTTHSATPLSADTACKGGRKELPDRAEMLGHDSAAQAPDSTTITCRDVLAALESELTQPRCGNREHCRRAVASLRKCTTDASAPFDHAALRRWAASGLSASTLSRYTDALRAMCRRAGIDTALFGCIRAESAAAPAPAFRLDALRRAAERGIDAPAPVRMAMDALLLAVYAGGLTAQQLIDLRFDACDAMPAQARAIVEAYRAPRRRYVFPLSQGRLADASIARRLRLHMAAALRMAGIMPDAAPDADHAPAIHAALAARCAGTRRSVADTIRDMQPRWYAMRLRPQASIHTLLAATAPFAATYYPCRETVRRDSGRLTTSSEPYIPGVLFFRTTPDRLAPLFAAVGSLAWGYRLSAAPQAPYAPIQDHAMLTFQRMVAVFTPDMHPGPITAEPLTPGRRVRVAGGIMEGYEGTIHDTAPGSDRRIFRLHLIGDFGFQWTADVPESLIQPL